MLKASITSLSTAPAPSSTNTTNNEIKQLTNVSSLSTAEVYVHVFVYN